VPAPAGSAAADLDPASMMETPGPAPHMIQPARAHNGVTTHGVGPRASIPAMLMPPVESDAMNALNLRNGGAAPAPSSSSPRIMATPVVAEWAGPTPELAAGRHRNAKFIVAVLAVVGVVCVLLLLGVMRKSPPPVAATSATENQFANLAEKVAMEKPAPPPAVVQPPPPPPPEPVKTKPAPRGHGGGKVRGPAHPPAPPTAPQPAPDPATAARLREAAGRPVMAPSAAASSSRPPPSQPDIMRVVSNNKTAIQACYQRALLRDNSLTRGKISVHLTIGISGRVKAVQLDSPANFRAVEPCIREVVQRWMFPAGPDSYETEFPFVFQGRE
jgi:periplasmic protein TonB